MKEKLKSFLFLIAIAVAGHLIAHKMFDIPNQMEMVVFVALILFYPVMRSPVFGVKALFIIVPFIPFIRRLYYLAFSRPKIDPLIMIGELIIAFIFLGLFFEFRERQKEQSDAFYMRLISLYFIYLLLRVFLFNITPTATALAKFKYYGPAVLLFFIGMYYAEKISLLKFIWAVTIVLGVAGTLYGIKQLYIGYSAAEKVWINSISFSTLAIEGVVRPFSIFIAPVTFADYLQLATIGILMYWFWGDKSHRILVFALVPLFFFSVLITSVRSSWIGMVASLMLWFLVVNVKGRKKRIAIILIMGLGYVFFELISEMFNAGGIGNLIKFATGGLGGDKYISLLVAERSTAVTNPFEEHSFVSRMALWRYLLYLSKEPVNALMGRGLGALKADSLYFTYFAEFGYPGVLFIITIFILFVRKGFQIIDNSIDRNHVILAKGITVMNIVFALVSITGTHIHNFPGDIYFWFWNGVLIKIGIMEERCDLTAETEGGDVSGAIPAGQLSGQHE
ncbi:MAG: hypothetical protein GF401_20795 [Chitinivibrionales bacterium]|nr:hypothetical protein [Chitinivibrionales bacterium]